MQRTAIDAGEIFKEEPERKVAQIIQKRNILIFPDYADLTGALDQLKCGARIFDGVA